MPASTDLSCKVQAQASVRPERFGGFVCRYLPFTRAPLWWILLAIE